MRLSLAVLCGREVVLGLGAFPNFVHGGSEGFRAHSTVFALLVPQKANTAPDEEWLRLPIQKNRPPFSWVGAKNHAQAHDVKRGEIGNRPLQISFSRTQTPPKK